MWSSGRSWHEPQGRSQGECRRSRGEGAAVNPNETLRALAELAQDIHHPVPSPCVSVCRMDPHSGLCLGCWRNIDEIITWGRMGEEGKRGVWQAITERLATQPG